MLLAKELCRQNKYGKEQPAVGNKKFKGHQWVHAGNGCDKDPGQVKTIGNENGVRENAFIENRLHHLHSGINQHQQNKNGLGGHKQRYRQVDVFPGIDGKGDKKPDGIQRPAWFVKYTVKEKQNKRDRENKKTLFDRGKKQEGGKKSRDPQQFFIQ